MENLDKEYALNIIGEDSADEMKASILGKYKIIIENIEGIYIFGTKSLGIKTLKCFEHIGMEVKGFIDNNKRIKGNYINGKKVYGLDEINNDDNSVIVIASIMYMNEIINQLEKSSFKNVIPYPILTLWNEKNFPAQFTLINLQEDLTENKMQYSKLFSIFEDYRSKYILSNIIKFRKTLEFKYMNLCYDIEETQYFENDIIQLNKNEVFVDGGAFNGDSALEFIKRSKNTYKKIYLFEPDKGLLDIARKNLGEYKNIIFNNLGLYFEDKVLRFNSTGGLDGTIGKEGEYEINVTSLDSFVKENITFLKLDIEGDEIYAINGAAEHIKNSKPKLAISVYHNNSDIWKIPQLLKSINPNYKFYLRHYTHNVADTVLYCV